MIDRRDRNYKKRDFKNYLELTSKGATFSNAFNLSFGNLNKMESSIFRIFVSQIDKKDIDKSQKTYTMSYNTLARLLNHGELNPRGNSFNNIANHIQDLVNKSFVVPVYSSKNKINGCTWGNYFDYITIYDVKDKGENESDFSDAKIKYRFSYSIYPYVIGYISLGLGSFNAPNRILSQIKSNKEKKLFIASLGRLENKDSGTITLTPENWAITLNGTKMLHSESNSFLFYRMKKMADSLNKKFSKDFKLTVTCDKKPIKEGSEKNKIATITTSIQVFAEDIKSSARNIDNDDICFDNIDLKNTKGKEKINNGKFKVVKENTVNKEPNKDKGGEEDKDLKKQLHKMYNQDKENKNDRKGEKLL